MLSEKHWHNERKSVEGKEKGRGWEREGNEEEKKDLASHLFNYFSLPSTKSKHPSWIFII